MPLVVAIMLTGLLAVAFEAGQAYAEGALRLCTISTRCATLPRQLDMDAPVAP
jgi:hypothetical protein